MTKQNFSRWFTLLAVLVLSVVPYVAFADGSFLCKPTEGAGSQNDVFNCVISIRNAAIAISAIAAVFIISYAGYLYMLSGGSEGNVSKAKDLIKGAIFGLVILLAGSLVLSFINPDLLNFRSISPEQIASRYWALDDGTIVASPNKPAGATSAVPGKDVKNCPTGIQDIPADVAGRTGEKACTTLIEALRAIKAQGGNFIVTDAFGKGHDSICHKISGTCADLVPTSNTPAGWNQLCVAVKATGKFRIVNEYKGGGAPECGAFYQSNKTTGNHLHIVLQSAQDDLAGTTSTQNNTQAGWPTGPVTGKGGAVCNGGSATRGSESAKCSQYSAEIAAAASSSGLSAATIKTLIHIESQFNAGASSSQGAKGLMQVQPGTASTYGCAGNWSTDPAANIACGAKIFKALIAKYGDVDSAIADYNGGPGSLGASVDCPGQKRWQCAFDNPEQTVCNTGFLESRNYVLNYKALLSKYQSCGG